MPRIAILGAGPAGLATAKYLANEGVKADLFERTNRIGGLHRSVEIQGLHYDIGTFVFAGNHALLDAFPGLREMMVPIRYSPAAITPKNSVDQYPFTLKRYIADNGVSQLLPVFWDLLTAKIKYRNFRTVPEFAYYYLGKSLYESSGLKDYIRRLHGAADEELDIEFAKKRMTPISAMSFRNQVNRKFRQTRRKIQGKKNTGLRDRSARPENGFAPFYGHIKEDLEAAGVNFCFDSNVESITKEGGEFSVVVNGQAHRYDRVVSTLPLPVALRLCGLPTNDVTETRSLVTLFYRGKFRLKQPVVFNFTPKSEWKRITIFSKFYSLPDDGRDYFSVEITGDEKSDSLIDECRQDFESHAAELNLLEEPPQFEGSYFTERAYPVYRKGMTTKIEQDKDRLSEFGIDSIGRHGNFDYVISHWVALAAKELVESLKLNESESLETIKTNS